MVRLPFAMGRMRWWVLNTVAILAVTGACSSENVPETSAVPAKQAATTTVTKEITASVLITARARDASIDIETIKVSPSSIVVDMGEIVTLSAQAFGPDGGVLPGTDFAWAVMDPRVGTITREGRFHAGNVAGVYKEGVSVTGVQNTPNGIKHQSSTVKVNRDWRARGL